MNKARIACGVAGAALASAVLLAVPNGAGAAAARALEIYFVDVEGGAATLMVTPAGESILVDAGWPREDERDAKRIEEAARYAAGLSQIDHFVCTHWHLDHYGAIEALAKRMPVRNFWDRGMPPKLDEDARNFPTLTAAYKRAGGDKARTLKAGDTIPLRQSGAPLELKVVAASGKVIGEGKKEFPISCERHPEKPVDTSDNAQSISLLLKAGKFDFLNCGDLTWNVEHKLVCPKNRVGEVDLFQVTHHGMDISNNPAVLEAIQPRCAVITNGPRKGGSAATYQRLKSTPSVQGIFQLHRNVATRPEDNTRPEHIANLEEQCSGEYLRVRLNDGLTEYTVSKGTGAPLQTFKVR
ncbi:MAG: ComEC/Rec2 family competence protein [Armatimonadota bacterium]